MKARILKLGLLAALPVTLSTTSAWACEVCYGAAESPILEGMSASIVFMLATTYVVLIGMGLSFFVMRRRARRLQLVGRLRNSSPHSAALIAAGCVAPPRNIPDMTASARLASDNDGSPTEVTNFRDDPLAAATTGEGA